MNKKGELGDMFVFPAFAFLMGIVGGGIVIGTLMFIGSGYDFRAGDASLLGAKIKSCVNNGFDFSSLKNSEDINLLSEKCALDKNILESYYRIKICSRKVAVNVSECVGLANEKSILAWGDVQPCEFTDKTKFLGCSRKTMNDYLIITATNQQLRRNAK